MTDTETSELIVETRGKVTGIALPKDKPNSPMRNVTFEKPDGWTSPYPPSGWRFADKLDGIGIGEVADYRIEKIDGHLKLTSFARAGSEGTSAPGESQRDQEAPPPRSPGDVQGGGGSDRHVPPATAEHDVPNSDTQRFELYAFLAACGMVDLAYEELTDAKEAGVIYAVKPVLVKSIAGMLLNAADQAQRALVGRCDRSALSHTRARGAVRTALRSYPVSAELAKQPNPTAEWGDKLTKAATVLLQVAASL